LKFKIEIAQWSGYERKEMRGRKEKMGSVATVASPTISEETGHSKRVVHGWAVQKCLASSSPALRNIDSTTF
jgi:hypothetical protein